MTRNENFISLVEGYLDEYQGSTPLPESVSDAVRARFRSTMQLGASSRPAWRLNSFETFAVAAAAVVVVAAIGIGLFPTGGDPNVGQPTPSSDLTSGSSDPATPSPGIEVAELEARGADPRIQVTVGVPDGWTHQGHAVTTGSGSTHAGVSAWTIGAFVVDPCDWDGGGVVNVPADAGTASSVVSTLLIAWAPDSEGAAATAPSVSEAREAMLGGYPGQYLELTAPSDIDFAECDGMGYRLWLAYDEATRILYAPGRVQRLWFLEVGTQVVVVDVTYTPVTSDAPESWDEVIAELDTLIATLEIRSADE